MPAIIDREPDGAREPVSVFESGAILEYLAEKSGRFLPGDVRGRYETLQWLFWQVAGLGPMAGQNHHFSQYAPERIPELVADPNRNRVRAGRDAVQGAVRRSRWFLEQAPQRRNAPFLLEPSGQSEESVVYVVAAPCRSTTTTRRRA